MLSGHISKNIFELRAILYTKDGRILKKYPWKKANSLVKPFIQVLMVQMSQVSQSIIDTINTARTIPVATGNLRADAALNITTYGILIGSGITPVAMSDYKLETQIITNVEHAIQTVALENPNAQTWRISITRPFSNNTGGVLSIKEVALYARAGTTLYNFCIERTLYSVDVPAGLPITFTYRITITL